MAGTGFKGHWGWVVVGSAFIVQFIAFGITSSIGLYNIHLLRLYPDNAVLVSLIASINMGILLGSGPIVSFLMLKWEHRTIALGGAVLSSLGMLVVAFSQHIVALYLAFGVLAGFGYCLAYLASHVLSGLYFQRHCSLATGLASSGAGLGNAVVPILVELLIHHYGWRTSLLLLAAVNLHLLPAAALLRPLPKARAKAASVASGKNLSSVELGGGQTDSCHEDADTSGPNTHLLCAERDSTSSKVRDSGIEEVVGTKSRQENSHLDTAVQLKQRLVSCNLGTAECASAVKTSGAADSENNATLLSKAPAQADSAATENSTESREGPVIHSYRVFKDFGFDVFFFNNIMFNLGIAVYVAFAPPLFTQLGHSEQDAATLFVAMGCGEFLGEIAGGVLGSLQCCHRLALFSAANVALGLLTAVVPLVPDFWPLLLLSGGVGLCQGLLLGLLVILCVDVLGPQNLGTAMGFLFLANGMGAFVGPPLAGALYDSTAAYNSSFYVAGGLTGLGGLVLLLVPLQASQCPSLSLASRQAALAKQ